MANVCVIFEHVETDQDRSTFYNRECGYRFVKCGILRVVPGRNRAAFFLNLVLTALLCRARYRKRQISLVISGNPHIACALGIVHRLSRAKVKHVVWNFNAHRVYTGFQRSVEPLPIVYTKIGDFLGGPIAGEYAAGASGAEPLAQRSGASDPPRLSTPVYTSAGVQSPNAWCGRSSL
jgi:hypothetical protein